MKPKLTDEEKKELIQACIGSLRQCKKLLDKAYIRHTIKTKKAANDETANN